MEDENYLVLEEPFAEKHFIKRFLKKYKDKWSISYDTIIFALQRLDNLLKTDKADIVSDIDGLKIVKVKFRIPGTNESAKASGNRCIVLVDDKKRTVSILLVYCKTDFPGGNETAQWKSLIRDNYPQYKRAFGK